MPCRFRVEAPLERRPANALNLEIGQPAARCTLRYPEHWPDGMVLRWLGSGGSPLVLGVCAGSALPVCAAGVST